MGRSPTGAVDQPQIRQAPRQPAEYSQLLTRLRGAHAKEASAKILTKFSTPNKGMFITYYFLMIFQFY